MLFYPKYQNLYSQPCLVWFVGIILSHHNIIFQNKLFFSILLPRMFPIPSFRSECNILKEGTEKSFLLTLFFSASRSFRKGSVWLHKSFWYFPNWFWLCDEPVLHFHMFSKEYMSLSRMSPDLREVETVVDSGRCFRYSMNLHRGLLASPLLVSDHSIMGFILCSWNHHSFWFQQTNLIQAHWILILVTRDLFLFVQDYDKIADSNTTPTAFLGGQVLYSISGFLTMQKLSKPCRGFVKTSLPMYDG